jgi:drug/metabolite transporter (DMT)-like permease
MNWFLIALINPVAHAFANHLDKYILSRYMKGGSVGALILFTTLLAIIILPVIVIVHPQVFDTISVFRAVILMLNGCLLSLAIIFYLYALHTDEASFVAPFFQLVPIFGIGLGYLILNEVLRQQELIGVILIVFGGILLSLELANGPLRFKKKLLLLMVGSSFFYAVNGVVFKSIAVHQGFLDSLFWDMTGKVLLGLALFALVKPYRHQFINLIKVNRFSIIGFSILTEIIGIIGEIALVLAVLFAPVALVQSVGGLQPLFVFLIGVVITLFLPRLGQESLQPKLLLQKIAGIVLMTAGVYALGIFN